MAGEAQSLVSYEERGPVAVVTIHRHAAARNAVDGPTAAALNDCFRRFEADDAMSVAVLAGEGGTFCAGADLKSIGTPRQLRLEPDGDAPMGLSRLQLSKPVIAAVEGHAVAGGFELAMWCDLRIAARDAVFGIFCRRWGVPLMDGGTIRLARLIGMSHALDLILTGRGVSGEEALRMGIANRLVAPGAALDAAIELAEQLARFPQACLRSDRLAVYEQWAMPLAEAHSNEFRRGMEVIASGETVVGAQRFAGGEGRHGSFDSFE
jgi:enoyl-CoA hydratase